MGTLKRCMKVRQSAWPCTTAGRVSAALEHAGARSGRVPTLMDRLKTPKRSPASESAPAPQPAAGQALQ